MMKLVASGFRKKCNILITDMYATCYLEDDNTTIFLFTFIAHAREDNLLFCRRFYYEGPALLGRWYPEKLEALLDKKIIIA